MAHGTLSTNGTTDVVTIDNPMLACSGTWGSGTMTWQVQGPNGTWYDAKNGTTAVAYTADHMTKLDAPRCVAVRGVLTGATGPSLVWRIT